MSTLLVVMRLAYTENEQLKVSAWNPIKKKSPDERGREVFIKPLGKWMEKFLDAADILY